MSFVSVTFLIFLPIVFGAYWMLWRHHRAQNMLLLVASYGLPAYVRWVLYYLLFFVTFFARGEEQTFIYFQF